MPSRYHPMELRHFRYFQAVAEELSFSKAARRLRVAQPALSRAVKELEHRVGAELLTRSRRGVALNEAGAVFLHEIGLILQRVDDAVRRVRRTASGEEGELRVGYIGPPTQAFLGRLLADFRSRYPRVSVILEERTPERVWEMVARGRLAIGLTRPVLARQEGVGLHDAILAACRRAHFTPKLAQTPSVIHTVLSYVEAGEGIGIIPDSVASLGKGGPLVFRPLTPTQAVELVMVWSAEDTSPAAAAFRALVGEWKKSRALWQSH